MASATIAPDIHGIEKDRKSHKMPNHDTIRDQPQGRRKLQKETTPITNGRKKCPDAATIIPTSKEKCPHVSRYKQTSITEIHIISNRLL